MTHYFAEVKGHECADCGEKFEDVAVGCLDTGCHGIRLLSADLSPQMVADLVDVLVEWQNK